MSYRFDAIVFDMDGLMIDTERLYWDVARELAGQYGKTVTETTLRNMMGRSTLDSITLFGRDLGIPETPQRLSEIREELVIARFRQGITPMPGLLEMLDAFHGRLKLGIATSAPRHFLDVILPQLHIEHLFDAVQTGDTVARGKPDPEIFLKAIARLGVEPARTIVLEDSRSGAMAGRNAGAFVLAVPSELSAADDFSFADYRAGSLEEARAYIEGML